MYCENTMIIKKTVNQLNRGLEESAGETVGGARFRHVLDNAAGIYVLGLNLIGVVTRKNTHCFVWFNKLSAKIQLSQKLPFLRLALPNYTMLFLPTIKGDCGLII